MYHDVDFVSIVFLSMQLEKTLFPDAFLITPDVFHDHRGYFFEAYHQTKFKDIGLNVPFVQDNFSYSKKNVLRGMHLQWGPHTGKLVRVAQGIVYDVIVDIKRGSPTFGKWFGAELSEENHKMFWVPPGYAHGFVVLSDEARVEYKCTGAYARNTEASIRWNDPAIGIQWPVKNPVLAEKDQNAQLLAEWAAKPEFVVFNDTLPENPILKV